MAADKRQITIYYNPEINKHKKTIAHAKSMGEVLALPFEKMPTAYNIWTNIWQSVEKAPNTIFDKDHPKYDELIKDKAFEFEGWRQIAVHNLDMLGTPIAIRGDKAVLCVRQTEVYELFDNQLDGSIEVRKTTDTVPGDY